MIKIDKFVSTNHHKVLYHTSLPPYFFKSNSIFSIPEAVFYS